MASKFLRDAALQQREGARHMASAGVIGLHMVSGPLVGFAIGYGLDAWLGLAPWCGMIFFFIGIGAGFLNVWRDTKLATAKMDRDRGEKDPDSAK